MVKAVIKRQRAVSQTRINVNNKNIAALVSEMSIKQHKREL